MKKKYIKPKLSPMYVAELMQNVGVDGSDEAESLGAKKINWDEDWDEGKDNPTSKSFDESVYPVNPNPWDE